MTSTRVISMIFGIRTKVLSRETEKEYQRKNKNVLAPLTRSLERGVEKKKISFTGQTY